MLGCARVRLLTPVAAEGPEGTFAEQGAPHGVAEEEAVRPGAGEERTLGPGGAARRRPAGGPEAAEEAGATARGAGLRQALQYGAQGPALPHQRAEGRREGGPDPHLQRKGHLTPRGVARQRGGVAI